MLISTLLLYTTHTQVRARIYVCVAIRAQKIKFSYLNYMFYDMQDERKKYKKIR